MAYEEQIARMVQCLRIKNKLLREILEFIHIQTGLIEKAQFDELNKILEFNQGKMDELDKVEKEFNRCFAIIKEPLRINSLQEIQDGAFKGIDEGKRLLIENQAAQDKIRTLLNQTKDRVQTLLETTAAEIAKVHQGKNATNAYFNKNASDITNYNKKG